MTSDLCRRVGRAAAATLLGGAMMLMPAATAAAQTGTTSTLSVWIDGWGSGTVTSSPAGINCHLATSPGNPYEGGGEQTLSGPCHADFPVGTVVALTATPDANSELNGMDCGTGTVNPCKKTIVSGYNAVWAMFCPRDGLCSA
jgi:hypothetical protein